MYSIARKELFIFIFLKIINVGLERIIWHLFLLPFWTFWHFKTLVDRIGRSKTFLTEALH